MVVWARVVVSVLSFSPVWSRCPCPGHGWGPHCILLSETKMQVWFLLNVYHFCTMIKLNHCKSGAVYTYKVTPSSCLDFSRDHAKRFLSATWPHSSLSNLILSHPRRVSSKALSTKSPCGFLVSLLSSQGLHLDFPPLGERGGKQMDQAS